MLLVEPTAAQINIFSQFTLPRLGSFILAGLAERTGGWRPRVFIEGRRRLDLDRWIAEHGRPVVVGISTITATAKPGYALAEACRVRGIPVVLGGPHVTFLPEEALEHAPLVVRGEGEEAMKALLRLWGDGRVEAHDPRYADVPNLSWMDAAGAVRHNPLAPPVADLDASPVPDFSLAEGTADCMIGGLKTVMVQTSRGCPFDCSFCSVTGMFGKKLRHRSVGSVMEELRRYDSRNHFVFFCDDNFTANRRRARELLEAMAGARFRFQWSTQVRADLARDPELVAMMKRTGCHTVFIGFESVNPGSLAAMKKNQDLEDIGHAARVIQGAGIHIHGMFVLGFDGENGTTAEAAVRFAQEAALTSVQLLILTPLPGSELYEQFRDQGRIRTRDWDLYDAHHVVYEPVGQTACDLQRGQVLGHARLYALSQTLQKLVTGRWVSAGLSFYAWKINREWQRRNEAYLRDLAAGGPNPAAA
jgi:radical SAM superfamily enzyme YgiQ (UPF0313 family)